MTGLGLGNYEISRAGTREVAKECVDCAIAKIERAYLIWKEGEMDASLTSCERLERRRMLNVHVDDFKLQWANVKFLLEDAK